MNSIQTGPLRLHDLYPEIERLILFVAFEEADAEAEPNYQQIILTENSAAAFRLGCSRDECVDGGFDFEPFIAELIRSGEQRSQGRLSCQGSLGRGDKSLPCALQSEYRIIIERKRTKLPMLPEQVSTALPCSKEDCVLYIVQRIVPGMVAPPRVFADQACAQTAFVALVREHRAVDFAKYCASNEADAEAFATAKAFADSGGGENACFCYWELVPEAGGVAGKHLLIPPQSGEPVLKAVEETQQQVLGVQTQLRSLTEKLTGMSQELIRLQNLLGDDGKEVVADEASGAAELSKPMPNALDEKYQTAEWQEFVQSLIRMCGGNRGEFPLLPRQDWRQAVYDNHSTLPYWEWAAISIDQSIERAKTTGYAIEEDGEQSGHFTYLTPTGERSSTLYEMEDLAWCAAGLHATQRDCTQS